MTEIVVYGDTELAQAYTHVLGVWGHTVQSVTNASELTHNVDVFWIAQDTPITEDGFSQKTEFRETIHTYLSQLPSHTLTLLSSQVPAGFNRSLQRVWPHLDFVSIPEYFRTDHVLAGLQDPRVIVVGLDANIDRDRIYRIYPQQFHSRILWMSPESSEMSKSALNVLLGMSIVFANQMAYLCDAVGADYADVERFLRGDPRVGQRAYLTAGPANGSHFLRDMHYLDEEVPKSSELIKTLLKLWGTNGGTS